MSMDKEKVRLILALYPNTRGIGYACFDMKEKKVVDTGTVTVTRLWNEKTIGRVMEYIEFCRPHLVILRDAAPGGSSSETRAQKLIDEIARQSALMGINAHRYSRKQVKDVFEIFGARTKHEIVSQIVEWFPEMSARAPRIRKIWMSEDYGMAVFDAVSLAMTYLYIDE